MVDGSGSAKLELEPFGSRPAGRSMQLQKYEPLNVA